MLEPGTRVKLETVFWLASVGLVAMLLAVLVWCLWRWQATVHRRAAGAPVRLGAQVEGRSATLPVELSELGGCRIERQLGRGAMGVVYLGRELDSGRQVALKTMALASEFDEDALADARNRFFREAETASRLHHPGTVRVFGSGEDHDLAWIAMEFLPGQPLTEWTRPDTLLPLPEALAVVRQAALALDYAHRQQVVHRDIKPANLMYDPGTRKVKLTDFGVARLTDSNRTRTGLVLGTPAFMSPEQLAGARIDARSDLFSLGVTLYQLTTGQLPFTAKSLGELMYAITHHSPLDPRIANPRLPAALAAIIMKALQKETAARFQTGAQFALALARLEVALKGNKPHAKPT
ncbi:MAG: serine/threonine protein kinase [Proteobacteria bacterium]|nr:serine/threonine protein kinase [Pseudomonadota bacterium]